MRSKLLIIGLCCLMINCNGQSTKKDTVMTTEKFDIEAYNKRIEKDPYNGDIIILEDGTEVRQGISARDKSASEYILPPPPAFYKINKGYYGGNYRLQFILKHIGGMPIDTTHFFDEQGRLVREVDENAKFGKHHYNDALQFLEKEGWINIETGEGRERFSLGFENDIWYITIMADMWNGYLETYYEVDANTMGILKKEVTQRGEE